jgi:lysophospholipase L1-like esterase
MSHAIWIGDSVTQGAGATSAAKRYSTLASQNLNLTEHNYATANTGYTTPDATGNFTTQLDTAITDTSYPHNQTGYVFLMGGLNDPYSALAAMPQAVAGLIAKAKSAYPNARIVVGVGPGCIPDSTDDDAIAEQGHVLTAIRLAATNAGALVIPDMRSICGTDPSLHANGINPNDDGHELLAKAVEAAIIADRGEPEDAPVTDLQRIYVSQGVDQFAREVNARRKREAAKNEANRPTGTELTQLTSKLDALTQIQALQQIILQQQQSVLQRQQEDLMRVTPTYATSDVDSPGGSLGSDWTNLISLTAHPDLSDGKTRAQLTIGVSAIKSGDGMPLLECLVGGQRVGTFPGVTANGDSFGGTTIAYVTADQPVVLRGKSTVAAASPINAVHMSMTVMNLA